MSRDARNAALEAWYRDTAIQYPWRDVGDPYLVLVSEVMLQQTQAGRVVAHFERFVGRFPTLESLADAPLGEVLALWSGLGYNSRAKRLRDAARHVVATGWPERLTDLPGVGPYTAAALGSFAFGRHVAAVDTNLRRVLSRWSGRALCGTELDAVATRELGSDASVWNQAVMDLGATVCTAKAPRCDVCPVSTWCAGPDTYLAPRPQGTFKGSNREARGAVLRTLINGSKPINGLTAATQLSSERIRDAVDQLEAEGLVVACTGGYSLAE